MKFGASSTLFKYLIIHSAVDSCILKFFSSISLQVVSFSIMAAMESVMYILDIVCSSIFLSHCILRSSSVVLLNSRLRSLRSSENTSHLSSVLCLSMQLGQAFDLQDSQGLLCKCRARQSWHRKYERKLLSFRSSVSPSTPLIGNRWSVLHSGQVRLPWLSIRP